MKDKTKVAPNVHQIPGTICNLFLIVEPEGLTLIDAGLKGTEKKILQFIATLGRQPRDLKRILITHSDGDHVGALAALKTATGARVYASEIEARAIANGKPSRELKPTGAYKILFALLTPLMTRVFGASRTSVDEIFSANQVLPVLGELRVVATSGHTPGHVSFFIPSVGVLFVGDSLIVRDGNLRGSTGMNNWDQPQANASVRLQAALGARIVCSGHGEVVHDAMGKFPNV
jgi:glyoxylase-like metal-dependent hydrolase (beta-lactamase superfamily II)